MVPVKYSSAQTIETRHVLVGHSARTRHIRRMIDKMGKCRWPALLLGETGTGKEVVARAIHNISASGPFVTVDCSSMVGPLMESELFRRDLYFRLNVINIRLSPLRERREDIPTLIYHFLSRVGGSYSMTAEALEVMLSYEWPGNVRELENCVQHMVAINSGPLLHVADFPSSLQ